MTLPGCASQAEIKALLAEGRWPHACGEELLVHAQSCRSCSDLVLVSEAFRRASVATAKAAVLPAPGILWWRAQMRRRYAAVERIGRPIVGAQVFALALYGLVVAGFGVWQARRGADIFAWLAWLTGPGRAGLVQSSAFRLDVLLPDVTAKSLASLPMLVPGVVMLALLGGVVVFLAAERE